jgi:hypothetical protein
MIGLALVAWLAQDPPSGADFFEKKIRPVLIERCFECHSGQAKKPKGGLLLDSRAGLLRGGDSGPAIVPGNAGASLLLKAVRWDDKDLKMPPKKRLPEAELSDLERWITSGAVWPGPSEAPSAKPRKQVGLSIEEGKSFWAYRPVAAKPGVIDRFIQAGLEAAGLRPAPPAEKPALLRRLYYDLSGLPPTPEAVEAFVRDSSPDAYERTVDRLLASPSFGERWGRHWLDVVRYAESLTLRGFIFKEAWRYRDYVIDAFNSDLPFDVFIQEQIAGDLLGGTPPERRRRLVASTFLVLGNSNLEEQDKKQLDMDVVDEQLDTLGRAFLAQTIGCARCHDHKFDPIPTRDYYALAGILRNARTLEHANVSKWLETPLPADPAREAELEKQEEAVAALQARIRREREKGAAVTRIQPGKPALVVAVGDLPGVVVDDSKAVKVGVWKESTYSGTYIGDGYVHDDNAGKGEKSLTFHPDLSAGTYEVRFAYSPGPSRASNVPVTILSAEGEKVVAVNEQEHPLLDGRFVSLGRFRFENNQGYVMVSNEGTKGHVTADAVVFLPLDKGERAQDPASSSATVKELEEELKKLQERGPRRDMAMTVREEKETSDARIHLRGSVHTLGEKVPRGVLQVTLDGPAPAMPPGESGRRELARWIASRENPLTARVFVNRAWHWLMGSGIVRTTDTFGTTGERPSHPELLDGLAAQFVADGWSVKRLVRRIVLSETYRRQATAERSPKDPENRLFGHMNRRRLDAECLRDTMLLVSGRLSPGSPGGPTYPSSLSADYGYRHAGTERSVYVPVFRNALPEFLELFDFGDASVPVGRRETSIVAPQALFLLNSPFVLAQAQSAADRLLSEPLPDEGERLARAYAWVLGRPPSEGEKATGLRFVRGVPDARQAWTSFFHALFASADFRYVN